MKTQNTRWNSRRKRYVNYRSRLLGEPRRKNELRENFHVSSWDKDKPIVIFNRRDGTPWSLTPYKEYQVIETKMSAYSDDDIYKRGSRYCYHQMPYFIKIINDLGKKKIYPQELFRLPTQSLVESNK